MASAFTAYSLAMMIRRLDTSSSDAINERRRQMSACRRKYAALGMAGRPQIFLQRLLQRRSLRYGSRPAALGWSFFHRPLLSFLSERAAMGRRLGLRAG